MIRTTKVIVPNDFLHALANKGEQIVATSLEFPSVKYGTHDKAIRGIEVNQEENGYEVRVCSYASVEDYILFAKTIDVLIGLTRGKAYYEDCDDDPIENPIERFNTDWIEEQRMSSFMATRALTKHIGSPAVLWGMFCHMCIGAKVYNDFDIPLRSEYKKEYMDTLQEYLLSIQWHFANLKDTSTDLVIQSENGNNLTISMICIKDGKVNNFDYISVASLLCLMDMDNKDDEPVLIEFENLWKILPEGVFRVIDEWQYKRIEEVTPDMVRQMIKKAKRFQIDDFHHDPIEPGNGFDDKQNTFILMWNPAISSVDLDEHNYGIENMLTEIFNWSVWEHEKAKIGDRFFLVRVGEGNTGIVMSGVFSSNPYEDSDWSGKGRQTYYMDMNPNVILNPEKVPMITTEQLMTAIPTFDWTGGHSGRILEKEDAKKLEKLWHDYIEANTKYIDGVNMNAVNINY
ncbi:MAG: hypothetical protein Q4C30_06615 [Bacteroidia bacterium]|nr:hypothetical protein [Bacteroidia bacterium]